MQLVTTLVHFFLTAAIFAFDYTLYWIQEVTGRNGNATFTANAQVGVSLEVEGGGAIAPLVKEFAKKFQVESEQRFQYIPLLTVCQSQ